QGAYILACDVGDPETGEVVAEGGRELSDALKKKLLKAGVTKVDVLLPAGRSESPLIKNTLLKDPTHTEAEALEQIYALLRPGEAPNLETARQALERLFFHPKRYAPGRVGRYKINKRLKVNVAKDHTNLTEANCSALIASLTGLAGRAPGPGAGRPHARALGLRGAGRALQPVWSHVPDRDAGGTEHRAHHESVVLRARQRPRLHRDAVPRGQERQSHRRDPLALGV